MTRSLFKHCFKCDLEKPFSEFYKHKQMADGHLGKCKECTKKDVALHYQENFEKIQAYEKKRATTPKRRQLNAKYSNKWRKETKGASAAQCKVTRALKKGILVRQACVVCGSEKSHGHHPDYSKPLSVIWLCQKHHKQAHKEMREAEGNR